MFVKICGITRLADAVTAAEAGANAIGLVFWPGSPRCVDPYRARKIVAALPPFVTAVGLFVNQSIDEIDAVASLVRLGAVQLHGDESPAFAASVRAPVIKAVSVDGAAAWEPRTTLLLDSPDPVKRGGTGQIIDWDRARAVAARRRVLLAGGLTPENVAEASARVQPFGVDISSGVESAPGIKDPARIRALFEALS